MLCRTFYSYSFFNSTFASYILGVLSLLDVFSSVQSLSRLFVTSWTAAHQASLSITWTSQLLELAQTHAHQASDAIQPSHPLSSPSPALNLSQHQGLFQ